MKFDTEGTYTLLYTATDECGNETKETREVEVFSLNTVLYADGTFIINEKSTDRNKNVAQHGSVTSTYAPMSEDGSNYVFASDSARPWLYDSRRITKVEMGTAIRPVSMAYWFEGASNLVAVDWEGLDTSDVVDMQYMFADCSSLASIDLSQLDLAKVTNLKGMFERCTSLTTAELSNLDTSAVTAMDYMFYTCRSLTTLNLEGFDTSNVTTMDSMFEDCEAIVTLDIASFDTSKTTKFSRMFAGCRKLHTIYASEKFVAPEGVTSGYMFGNMRDLVGGAGTVWRERNANNRTYAHIDGGTSNPGYFTAKA